MEITEEIDLELEFDLNPDRYVYSNWTLIEWPADQNEGDPKILYLKSYKQTNQSLKWGDTLGTIGGFVLVIHYLFGMCVNSVNVRYMKKKLY